MQPLKIKDVVLYVEQNIGDFHKRRIDALNTLELHDILKSKNPYLFKAKHILTSEELIRSFTDAYLSSREETIFGNWLEQLAIFINEKVYGGRKSSTSGIDLEFDDGGVRYIVVIKSGPNWGNKSQISQMKTDFITAQRTLRTSNSKINVIAVNGCCYGRDNKPDKGSYVKYCGQRFWEFVSGDTDLYTKLIEPLGHQAKERNDEFLEMYAQKIMIFNAAFMAEFVDNGKIDWDKLVKYNSSSAPLPKKARAKKVKSKK
jgi:hypothetical protein